MRRLAPLALLLLAAPIAAQAAMTVPMDQSRRVPLTGVMDTVVVGNKDIADVVTISSRSLMVVGKRPGATNLVVLDANGRTLFDSEIVVSAGAGSMVSAYRGGQLTGYACTPVCQQISGDAPAPIVQPPAAQPAPAAAPVTPAP